MCSAANLTVKINDKSDQINLKLALNMFIPRVVSMLMSPKRQDSYKPNKSGMITPKPKTANKYVKDNGTHSAFISNNTSYSSTPFNFEIAEVKERSRNDYKLLYQVGSGGFGRVWKVQEKRNTQILAMKEISKAKYVFIEIGC